VARELIALRCGAGEQRPVIGMFLGGAGLADTMLYCRHKIYPLGLPNSISHLITALAVLVRMVLKLKASFLPPGPSQLQLSSMNERLSGRFSVVAVTTLEKMLLSGSIGGGRSGLLKLIAVDERPLSVLRALIAGIGGKLGRSDVRGVHFHETDEISIEGENSDVILDGETFRAEIGRPIVLKPAHPLSFVRLAA
jgi:hypothetical protein